MVFQNHLFVKIIFSDLCVLWAFPGGNINKDCGYDCKWKEFLENTSTEQEISNPKNISPNSRTDEVGSLSLWHHNSKALQSLSCQSYELSQWEKRFSECSIWASKNKIVTLSPLSQSCSHWSLSLFSLLLKSLCLSVSLMIDSFDLALLVDIIINYHLFGYSNVYLCLYMLNHLKSNYILVLFKK